MINGKVEVKSRKDEVERDLQSKIAKALEQIGLTGESYAKLLCPVDTGNLRNSITHQVEDKTAYIGTAVEYGKYVEFGARGRDPQPFLEPAVKGHLAEYRLIAEQTLKD